MAVTLVELCGWLKTLDEVTLLELLDISAEELVDTFMDRVEEDYPRLLEEKARFDYQPFQNSVRGDNL